MASNDVILIIIHRENSKLINYEYENDFVEYCQFLKRKRVKQCSQLQFSASFLHDAAMNQDEGNFSIFQVLWKKNIWPKSKTFSGKSLNMYDK